MPAQVDGSAVEILSTAQQAAMVLASCVEVLVGTAGVVPTQAAGVHGQVVEALYEAQDAGQVLGSAAEVYWEDFSGSGFVAGSVVEVLHGPAGSAPPRAILNGMVIEVWADPVSAGHVAASVVEVLWDPTGDDEKFWVQGDILDAGVFDLFDFGSGNAAR